MKTMQSHLERRAWRHEMQDGLTEIAMSVMFLVLLLTSNNPALSWLLILPVVVLGPGLKVLRARFTYPRIGYVEPCAEDPGTLARGMFTYVVATILAVVLVLTVTRMGFSAQALHRIAPLIAGVLFGGGLRYAAGRTGLLRYTVLLIIALILGALLVVFPIDHGHTSMRVFFSSMAVVTFVTGLILFHRFLRSHPVRDGEEADDD